MYKNSAKRSYVNFLGQKRIIVKNAFMMQPELQTYGAKWDDVHNGWAIGEEDFNCAKHRVKFFHGPEKLEQALSRCTIIPLDEARPEAA